jgi:hypothetical protein
MPRPAFNVRDRRVTLGAASEHEPVADHLTEQSAIPVDGEGHSAPGPQDDRGGVTPHPLDIAGIGAAPVRDRHDLELDPLRPAVGSTAHLVTASSIALEWPKCGIATTDVAYA